MSILIMKDYLSGASTKKHMSDRRVFLFKDSYYELNLFFKKLDTIQTLKNELAKIVFIDVVQLAKLKLKEFKNLESVIIDITNQPNMNNKILIDMIKLLHQNNIFVTLVASALKHDQLGLDKYQSGRIVMLPSKDRYLSEDLKEALQKISNDAMHPLIL